MNPRPERAYAAKALPGGDPPVTLGEPVPPGGIKTRYGCFGGYRGIGPRWEETMEYIPGRMHVYLCRQPLL
jgi:hypothetical protein